MTGTVHSIRVGLLILLIAHTMCNDNRVHTAVFYASATMQWTFVYVGGKCPQSYTVVVCINWTYPPARSTDVSRQQCGTVGHLLCVTTALIKDPLPLQLFIKRFLLMSLS